MKAILFCLLNFSICFSTQAQTYHSFMHDTAVWSEGESTWCCDAAFGVYQTYWVNFIMMGDTSFNNYQYKKIYWQRVGCNYANCLPCDNSISFPLLLGFIREDSSEKVFFQGHDFSVLPVQCFQESFDTEKILYDFDLSIGDTVSWKPYNQIVLAIDSIEAPNGEILRRIFFDYLSVDYWIESLGSEIGLFGSYQPPPFECQCAGLCAQATDLLPLNSSSPCGGIVNAVNEINRESQLKISPNPFSDFVSITSSFQSSSLLSVMTSEGQIILKKRLQPFEKISFTKNEFSKNDFIFFRLISDEGTSQSGIAIHIF